VEHPVATKRIAKAIEIEIDPSETKTADSYRFEDLRALKYLITARPLDGSKNSAFEALVCKKSSDVSDSIYSKIGDHLNLSTQFLKSGSDMELRITNGEPETLSVSLLRFET